MIKQFLDTTLIRIQDPLRLDKHNEPEPDFVLVTNKNYSSHHPGPEDTLLIIEVADSSLSYDLKIKTPLYAQHNIPEVWIIELTNKKIHTFQQPSNDTYQQQSSYTAGSISPSQVSGLMIDITELW